MPLRPPLSQGALAQARYHQMRAATRRQLAGLGDGTVPYVPSAAVQAAMTPNLPGTGPAMTQTAAVTATMKSAIIAAAVEVSLAQTIASTAADLAISAATDAAGTAIVGTAVSGAAATEACLAAGCCWPVVGWAFDALVIIGEFIASQSAKRQTAFVIQETKDHISAYGQKAQAEVDAMQLQIGEQQYPAAQALAASNQALSGLGGLPSWAREAISHFQVETIKVVGDVIANTGIIGAKLVGDKRGEALAKKKKKAFDDNSDRVQAMFAGKLKNPYRMFADGIDDIGRTLGDTQGVHVINQKCSELQSAAEADIDAWRTQTEAALQTPTYADAVTTNIAKALRGDPGFLANVTTVSANDKMLLNYFNGLNGTATEANSGGALVAMLGGVAAALWMFKH
jgi:hypothetical protein